MLTRGKSNGRKLTLYSMMEDGAQNSIFSIVSPNSTVPALEIHTVLKAL